MPETCTAPNEFEGFWRNPLKVLKDAWVSEFTLGKVNLELLLHINARLSRIEERLTLMSETLTDVDQELDQVETTLTGVATITTDLTAKQAAAFTDLEAKLASGQDATAEVNRLKAINASFGTVATNLTALAAAAVTADPGAPASVDPNAPTG